MTLFLGTGPGGATRWLLTVIAIATALAFAERLPAAGAPEVAWRALTFEAEKWLFTATAEVRLAEVSAAEVSREELGRRASPSSMLRMEILSRLFGRRSSHQLWIDRSDGRALKRRVVEQGSRQRMKVYRYGREGIHARRVNPADSEEAKSGDPAAWTVESKDFYPRGPAASGVLTEPAAILYLVSALEASAFEQDLEIWTFTRKRPLRTHIRPAGVEHLETAYRVAGRGESVPREVEAIVYAISSPANAGQDEDFALLGLEGDIEIAVERSSRIPLEIRGRIPILGRVVIRLASVELTE